jgi:membrane-bound lytic murein transglycosylase F
MLRTLALIVGLAVGVGGWYLMRSQQNKMPVLRVVTFANHSGFYKRNGNFEGFQYELIKQFADTCGMKLQIIINNDLTDNISGIHDGSYDILLHALPTTTALKEQMDFSIPLYKSRLVLVQRGKKMLDRGEMPLRTVFDLEDEQIFVEEHSVYVAQMEFIGEETGVHFKIVRQKDADNDILASLLDRGRIDYFACDELSARLLLQHYPLLDIRMPLGLHQQMAWGISKKQRTLKPAIDAWLGRFSKTPAYAALYNNHF